MAKCLDCGKAIVGVQGCGSCKYEKRRLYNLSKKYGITSDQYFEMYAAQGGRCAICGVHESELPKRLHVDHDHSCCPTGRSCGNCIRGLLCAKCNTSLGQFEAKPGLLLKAHEYLTGGG